MKFARFFGSNKDLTILERISSISNVSVDEMSSIHSERISIPAQTFIKEIKKIKSRIKDPFTVAVAESLIRWNCSMEPTMYVI